MGATTKLFYICYTLTTKKLNEDVRELMANKLNKVYAIRFEDRIKQLPIESLGIVKKSFGYKHIEVSMWVTENQIEAGKENLMAKLAEEIAYREEIIAEFKTNLITKWMN